MSQTATLEAPASQDQILITDEEGTEHRLDHIDGLSLEEYFLKAGVAVPAQGHTAVSGARRLKLDDTLQPGASVTLGRLVING